MKSRVVSTQLSHGGISSPPSVIDRGDGSGSFTGMSFSEGLDSEALLAEAVVEQPHADGPHVDTVFA